MKKIYPELDTREIEGFKSPAEILGRMPRALLLAYSGGADSSLLLRLLSAWCREHDTELFAAHVNHGIRGDEALRDRNFCIESAKKLGVKCFVLDADVPALAGERKKGLEETAREVRYDFFRKIMEKEDIEALVTAHNADDNLETMLFRFARGSSGRGLCGIPEKRELENGRIALRPILSVKKEEILDICRKLDIKYVCDSTNADIAYSRNRIRQNVIPQLSQINPSLQLSAARLSALLTEDCDFIDAEAKRLTEHADFDKLENLRALHPALLRRVLAEIFSRHSSAMLEYTHLEALSKLIGRGKTHAAVSLPGEITATVDFDRLRFARAEKASEICRESAPQNVPLTEGDTALAGGFVIALHSPAPESSQKNQSGEENIYTLFTQVTLSSDKIVGGLFARGRQPKDRIRQGGISKDVRKLMSEKRIPTGLRELYPIICDDQGIIWIPGIAVRDGAAAAWGEDALVITCRLSKDKNC